MARCLTFLILAASALPFATATFRHSAATTHNCKSDQFNFLGFCIDLDVNGNTDCKGTPPALKACPDAWFWNTRANHCTPQSPRNISPSPSCPGNHKWDSDAVCCKLSPRSPSPPSGPSRNSPPPSPGRPSPPSPPSRDGSPPPPGNPPSTPANSCGSNQFKWLGKKGSCCLPNGGHPSPPSPPSGTSCPSNWWWHSDQGCCVPKTPTPPSLSCPSDRVWNGWWCTKPSPPTPSNPTPPSAGNCNNGEFPWIGLKGQCCLPHGGHPNPPSPPPGKSCPSNWWWHGDQSCCVPKNPSPPQPTCPGGNIWRDQCCKPPAPQPSGYFSKRHQKKHTMTLCPAGLEACPLGGLFGQSADYECVDIVQDVQSCGGCSSTHSKFDCTAIKGSWNVGCEQGACHVYSCQSGYKLSALNTCVKL